MARFPTDKLSDEQLLAEVDDVLRSAPPWAEFQRQSNDFIEWIGRAAAAISRWDPPRIAAVNALMDGLLPAQGMLANSRSYFKLMQLLNQARADLRMTVGPLSVVVQKGQVFDYYDEVRKVIEPARADLFFVDPYLDADFVSRYLPHVPNSTPIRLLASNKRMQTLLPAVDLLAKQDGRSIAVRSSNDLHDRYVFVDKLACYVSGASFKDGAKNAPAALTQILDGFGSLWDTYETAWNNGAVQR